MVPRDYIEYAEFNNDVNFASSWPEMPFCANLSKKQKLSVWAKISHKTNLDMQNCVENMWC